MQRLNAIDAIAPAFTRTHEVLLHPFRVGRSWKLAASMYVGFAGSVFVPFPLFYLFTPMIPGMNTATVRAIVFVVATLGTLIFLGIFYLCARMSLVNFETVVTRQKFIAPMWRRYAQRVWPWIGLKVVLGTALSAAMAPLVFRAGKQFLATMLTMPRLLPGERPDPAMFLPFLHQILGFYSVFAVFFLVLKLASTLVDDFALPFFLLEDISLMAALRRGLGVLKADPLHSLLYLLLKAVLSVIGFLMQYIANFFALLLELVAGLLVGGLGAGALYLIAHVGGAAMRPVVALLGVAGLVLLYVAFAVCTFWFQTGSIGYLLTLLEAYAVYFLGGRYALLGNLLEPGPGPPFTPPPSFPSEDERKDRDGGPPLPMNPAVA
jgi:hypothetical protein